MKINRITWQNFRGLDDGEIDAQGHDVIISGRNGAGKSSIANLLPFVLEQGIAAKSFDDRGLVIDSQLPSVEIQFDTITLKRTVNARNNNKLFVNGEPVTATKFDEVVGEMTHNFYFYLINPFEFPLSHWRNQRDLLLKKFVEKSDDEPINVTPLKNEIRQLKKEASAIPARIEELQKQLENCPELEDFDATKLRLEARQEQLNFFMKQDTSGERKQLKARLDEKAAQREELAQRYLAVQKECPTCHQPIPKEDFINLRKQIADAGKKVAAELEKLKDELETFDVVHKIGISEAQRIKSLQDEVRQLTKAIDAHQRGVGIRQRISELADKEKSLNRRIAELEGQLADEQKRRQDAISANEEQINSQFEFVKFRIFKLRASGEIDEDCVAMMNGIPFPYLSKGEKFKAAMDILRTFQRIAQVEMPLFVDDAESYTANSFVDVPNQKFLFKVTDEDLRIKVEGTRDKGEVAT